jgi:hypothetical protein
VSPEDPRRRWVLFISNFSNDWDPYRDAFIDMFARGVGSIWGPSVDFPNFPARGTTYALHDWYATRAIPSAHYYSAYPEAAPRDIRAALRVNRES